MLVKKKQTSLRIMRRVMELFNQGVTDFELDTLEDFQGKTTRV